MLSLEQRSSFVYRVLVNLEYNIHQSSEKSIYSMSIPKRNIWNYGKLKCSDLH